ncbi:aminoacyl-tRNA deacylase [Corallococcus terminator]|nr:YbaK/EbsC family protein [Corallococcus terminator]
MTDLGEFLKREQVNARLLTLATPMTTAAAAAQELGIAVGGIFKSLVFTTDTDEVLVVVLPGDRRVDFKAVARVAGCRKVAFASRERALEATGYPPGGTPPLGHPHALRVFVDAAVLEYPEGYGGGGRPELLLRLTPAELLRVTKGTVGTLSIPTEATTP